MIDCWYSVSELGNIRPFEMQFYSDSGERSNVPAEQKPKCSRRTRIVSIPRPNQLAWGAERSSHYRISFPNIAAIDALTSC